MDQIVCTKYRIHSELQDEGKRSRLKQDDSGRLEICIFKRGSGSRGK